MRIVVHAETSAPPETAYGVVADIPNWPHFVDSIKRIELLTRGPVQIGTRFRETLAESGRTRTREMAVSTLDRPNRVILVAEDRGARQVTTIDCRTTDGTTRLSLTYEEIPYTLTANLANAMARWFGTDDARAQLQADLDDLAAEATRRVTLG